MGPKTTDDRSDGRAGWTDWAPRGDVDDDGYARGVMVDNS